MTGAYRQLSAIGGETLDALLWRERGLGPDDLAPVLAANPGIAGLGAIVPRGTIIRLPAPLVAAIRTLPIVRLWD